MNLVVSNIAWSNEEEESVARCLQGLGVKSIEIAPTKIWEDPTKVSDIEIKEYLEFWARHDIEVVAFQSMLFNRPDLELFKDNNNREETKKYLSDFIELAGKMNVKSMVFGSPKNRLKRKYEKIEADVIATKLFKELAGVAEANNTVFCIEPNPKEYGCDYITNSAEGVEIVSKVNRSGFRLHLDLAGMTLANEDISLSIESSASYLQHFHISSPYLGQVGANDVDHKGAAESLRKIGYKGHVSIEMKPSESGRNIDRVKSAVEFVQQVYRV